MQRRTLFCLIFLVICLPGRGSAQIRLLHSFSGPDGIAPEGTLLLGQGGIIYGTCGQGGLSNFGTLFEILPNGAFKVLYNFPGGGLANPNGALAQDAAGNLYVATSGYYGDGYGAIFKYSPASGQTTTFYSFAANAGATGALPYAGPILASDGNLYGTTYAGGLSALGTVYQLTLAGVLTTLHSFDGSDGQSPSAELMQAADGLLYGTAYAGDYYYGSAFRIDTSGNFQDITGFQNSFLGYPRAALVQGLDGTFYGTTSGQFGDYGSVFSEAPGSGAIYLHSFPSGSGDGFGPFAPLLFGSDGNLWGMAEYGGQYGKGTLFMLQWDTLNRRWDYSEGVSFDGAHGANPSTGGLVEAPGGVLLGNTQGGGAYDCGTIFEDHAYAYPVLTGISPGSRDAGSPGFNLAATGNALAPWSRVVWNGSPLSTTYVSSTKLVASVPAALLVSPGKAKVRVVTPDGGGESKPKTFTILVTSLKLITAALGTESSGTYSAVVQIENVGYLTAPDVQISTAVLNGVVTLTPLPVSLGSLLPQASATASLLFPPDAGSPGQKVVLKLSGDFTGGRFSGSVRVTLP